MRCVEDDTNNEAVGFEAQDLEVEISIGDWNNIISWKPIASG